MANPLDASFFLFTSVAAGIEDGNASTDSRNVCDVKGLCTLAGPILGRHNSGTVREWYNGQPADSGPGRDAGSRVRMTLGGTTSDYFLRSGFGLSTTAGSTRQSVDAVVNGQSPCPARPFTSLGVWSVVLP